MRPETKYARSGDIYVAYQVTGSGPVDVVWAPGTVFFTPEQVEAIVRDYSTASLTPAEVAMLAYAEKVPLIAYKATQKDIDELRSHGFSDAEILDIALVAAARNFMSKTLDAVGAEPDPEYLKLENSLREVLAVGVPFGLPGRGADTRSPAG